MGRWRNTEQRVIFGTRLVTLVAVVASFAGALLMLWLGLASTWRAFAIQLDDTEGSLPGDELTVIHVIGALDRFLIAIVLMFFGYGVYVLFVRPDATPRQLGLPKWLHVESIGQLKQTLAEVTVVVLFVLFLRVALETYSAGAARLEWDGVLAVLALPLAIALLTAGLRMAQFDPKPRAGSAPPQRENAGSRGRSGPGKAAPRDTGESDPGDGPAR